MAANENFRLADIALPDMRIDWPPGGNLGQAVGQMIEYIRELKAALVQRDLELKNKINQLHVEYVTSAPSAAPEDPEPVFRIYKDNGSYYLYVYINGAWKYASII